MVEIIGQEALHPARRSAVSHSGQVFLSTAPDWGNVDPGHTQMTRLIGHPLSAVSLDLLDVAAYLYVADLLVRRQVRTWARDLALTLPVRELDRWQACATPITQAVSRLSGDRIQIRFTKRRIDKQVGIVPEPPDRRPDQDCVVLCSGGLDSCAGIAQKLFRERRVPLLVSHTPSPIGSAQKRVGEELFRRANCKDKLRHLRLKLGVRPASRTVAPLSPVEPSQRMRSFLHLVLGTVTAQELGIDDLFVVDNGVLSINLPLVPCRAGSRSTRSTDPAFLDCFQRIVRGLYPRPLTIANPFLFQSKGDIVQLMLDLELQDVIKHTISCWGYPMGLISLARRRGTSLVHESASNRPLSHCGFCLPCLVRRTAITSRHAENYDARYFEDVVAHFGRYDWRHTSNLRDLAYFCTNIERLAQVAVREARGANGKQAERFLRARFLSEYPELGVLNCAPMPAGVRGEPIMDAIEMYRRFARETLAALNVMGDRAWHEWMM